MEKKINTKESIRSKELDEAGDPRRLLYTSVVEEGWEVARMRMGGGWMN